MKTIKTILQLILGVGGLFLVVGSVILSIMNLLHLETAILLFFSGAATVAFVLNWYIHEGLSGL